MAAAGAPWGRSVWDILSGRCLLVTLVTPALSSLLHLLPRSEHRLQSAKPPDMLFPLHDVPFAPIALQLTCRVLSKAANPSRSPGY